MVLEDRKNNILCILLLTLYLISFTSAIEKNKNNISEDTHVSYKLKNKNLNRFRKLISNPIHSLNKRKLNGDEIVNESKNNKELKTIDMTIYKDYIDIIIYYVNNYPETYKLQINQDSNTALSQQEIYEYFYAKMKDHLKNKKTSLEYLKTNYENSVKELDEKRSYTINNIDISILFLDNLDQNKIIMDATSIKKNISNLLKILQFTSPSLQKDVVRFLANKYPKILTSNKLNIKTLLKMVANIKDSDFYQYHEDVLKITLTIYPELVTSEIKMLFDMIKRIENHDNTMHITNFLISEVNSSFITNIDKCLDIVYTDDFTDYRKYILFMTIFNEDSIYWLERQDSIKRKNCFVKAFKIFKSMKNPHFGMVKTLKSIDENSFYYDKTFRKELYHTYQYKMNQMMKNNLLLLLPQIDIRMQIDGRNEHLNV